ncbi:3-keto-disaccharide hydrolase [Neolewinella sp.]|uniref:3-keto-disaccharide hydrolase n=1 Tax=Neolewinella sp. TaxID=2993543 RepID=UPI003B529EF6
MGEATAQEQVTQPAEAIDEDWTDLLAGNTLDHWQMYSQDELEGWELVNGELRASGAGWDAEKDLITKNDYADFELELEWKIEPGHSSGIFYLVPRDGVHQIYELAPEYQVMDDAGWDSPLEPNQLTAGNYAMHAPEGAGPRPVGEWNTTRIVVRQPRVEHWLNGTKVVDYELGSEDWKARKAAGKWAEVDDYALANSGRIGLQNAGEVTYRNIRIREL